MTKLKNKISLMITILGLVVVILGGLCASHFSSYFSKKSKSILPAEREVALGVLSTLKC